MKPRLANNLISFTPQANRCLLSGYTNHPFFKNTEEVIVTHFHDRIEFTRPELDYIGKTRKVTRKNDQNGSWVHVNSYALQKGTYPFSEDSDEDCLIIYYNEIIQETKKGIRSIN